MRSYNRLICYLRAPVSKDDLDLVDGLRYIGSCIMLIYCLLVSQCYKNNLLHTNTGERLFDEKNTLLRAILIHINAIHRMASHKDIFHLQISLSALLNIKIFLVKDTLSKR